MVDHRLLFQKEGRARFISHLDLMRTFQRAFFRAGISIKHTEGFHPHAFISIALPLSLGYSSQCEILEFGMEQPADGAEVARRLNEVLPEGIRVLACYAGGQPIKKLAFLDWRVTMEFSGEELAVSAEETLRALLQRESVVVRKKSKKAKCGYTEVDIIPRIKRWELGREGTRLVLSGVLAAQNPGLNPELIVTALREQVPECAPEMFWCHRREVLDENGAVFR